MLTENRRFLTALICLLAMVLLALLWEGRVAAMANLPGDQPTIADLVEEIEALKRQLWLSDNNQSYAMGVESMRAVWQDHEEENVDATHPLTLNVYIPTDCKLIDRAFLRLKLLAFRSYGTGAEAGGDHRHRVFEWNGVEMSDLCTTGSAGIHNHGGAVGDDGDHAHTYSGITYLTGFNAKVNTEGVIEGIVGLQVDWVPGHEYEIYTFDSSGEHTHGLVHGIYEGTSATNVTVTINGVDRTAALGGGAGFTTDQDSLDIAQYLTVGWNTIVLGSSQLGRIQATYFVKAYLS
jgi:hypothetical protein